MRRAAIACLCVVAVASCGGTTGPALERFPVRGRLANRAAWRFTATPNHGAPGWCERLTVTGGEQGAICWPKAVVRGASYTLFSDCASGTQVLSGRGVSDELRLAGVRLRFVRPPAGAGSAPFFAAALPRRARGATLRVPHRRPLGVPTAAHECRSARAHRTVFTTVSTERRRIAGRTRRGVVRLIDGRTFAASVD